MKIIKVFSSLILFSFLSVALASTPTSKETISVRAASETPIAQRADLNRFRIRRDASQTPTVDGDTISFTGGWHSNYLVTDEFNTLSTDYTLSADFIVNDYTYSADDGDDWFGFVVYFDNEKTNEGTTDNANYLVYLFKNDSTFESNGFIANYVFAMVNGKYISSTNFAVGTNDWQPNSGEWTMEMWSDATYSSSGTNQATENIRLLSNKFRVDQGFNIALRVQRTEHNGKLADVLSTTIEKNGNKYYSKTIALDAFTESSTHRKNTKPQIGFACSSLNNPLALSNVQFTDHAATERYSGLSFDEGAGSTTNNAIEMNGNQSNYVYFNDLPTTSERMTLSMSVDTEGQNEKSSIGFIYKYDAENYITMDLRWDGWSETVTDLNNIPTTTNHYIKASSGGEAAYSPFDNLDATKINTQLQKYLDYGGVSTDSSLPCSYDNNFNNFVLPVKSVVDEVETITDFGTGEAEDVRLFDMKIAFSKIRQTYRGETVDIFQIQITDSSNKKVAGGRIYNWYTCPLAVTSFVDKTETPKIGLFVNNAVSDYSVTVNNIKFNGGNLTVGDSSIATLIDALHMSETTVGQCETLYEDARTAFDALPQEGKTAFWTLDEYTAAADRLRAWAAYHNEVLDSDPYGSRNVSFFDKNNQDILILITLISTVVVVGCLAFIHAKKKQLARK